MIRQISLGSMVMYGLAALFLGVAVYFATLAGTQDNAFISSELGLATLSPNGPSGGMLVPASGCTPYEGGCGGYSPPPVPGCTDTGADNYDPAANVDDGSCIQPPTVSLEAQISPATAAGDPTYTTQVYAAPKDELAITWNSSNANSCDTTDLGGSATDSTSGTLTVDPNLDPGDDINYVVTCAGPLSSTPASILVSVPTINVNVFEANPDTVRRNETTTLEWDLELQTSLSATPAGDLTPYDYDCEIQGATPGNTPHVFSAADGVGSGSITTQPIWSRFISVLECGPNVYEEAEIEVVPTANEI